MPDVPPTPPSAVPPTLPDTAPRAVWFDGIVEGPRLRDGPIEQAAAALESLRLASVHLSMEGGRFSLMLGDEALTADRHDLDRRGEVPAILAALAQSLAAEGAPRAGQEVLESTLRATELYADCAVETVFVVQGTQVRALSKPRRLVPSDAGRMREAPRRRLGTPITAVLLAVGVVAFGLLFNVPARLFGPGADELRPALGELGELLEVSVEGAMGDYRVLVRRGPGYPDSRAAWDARLEVAARTASQAEFAKLRAVADGGDLWLWLADGTDQVLAVAPVDLQPLLLGPQHPAVAVLPARWGAEVVGIGLLGSDGR